MTCVILAVFQKKVDCSGIEVKLNLLHFLFLTHTYIYDLYIYDIYHVSFHLFSLDFNGKPI